MEPMVEFGEQPGEGTDPVRLVGGEIEKTGALDALELH